MAVPQGWEVRVTRQHLRSTSTPSQRRKFRLHAMETYWLESWERNFENVRFTLRSDAYSSPFLLRPIGVMSHRPTVFPDGSPEADLIVEWLDQAR